MENPEGAPGPGVLVKQFSWEMEIRGRAELDTEEFDQLRLDFIEQRKQESREREREMRRIEAYFSDTRPEDETLFDKTRQELMQCMKSFQGLVPEELRTAPMPTSWSEVELAVSTVQAQWDAKNKDSQMARTKQWIRKMCNGLNNHSTALEMLPKESEYVSLIGGAVSMIIKASANYTAITESFAKGVVSINDAVAMVQKSQVYDSPPLKQLAMRLYSRVFSYLTKFMKWYTDRSRTRFLKSFNESVQRIFEEDLGQVRQISLLLSQQIQLHISADVRVAKLLAEDTRWAVKYLVKLVETEQTQRKLQEETNARLLQSMFLGQFKNSQEEIKESLQSMMVEYNERMRQEISGRAITNLLTIQASRETSDDRRHSDSYNSSPLPSPQGARHIPHGDDSSLIDAELEEPYQNSEIKYRSRHLEEYCNWEHVFPFPDIPHHLCADATFVSRLSDFTTTLKSQILYAHGRYQPEHLSVLRSSAATYITLAREHGIPVISYFCQLSADEPPPSRTRESTELTALLYSMIRQAVELLPADFAAAPLAFGEERFAALDGTLRTWDLALELFSDAVGCVSLPQLLFVVDGLNLLEDDFEDVTSGQLEALVRRMGDLAGACESSGRVVKILFTTAGLSGTLCRELDGGQIVACEATSPLRESGSRRSRQFFLY